MSVLLRTIRTYSLRSGESPRASITLVKPMMAFRGVRSSWVIEAMKALFMRRLSSARSGLGDAGDVGGDALVTDDLPSVVEDGVEADVEHLSRLSL